MTLYSGCGNTFALVDNRQAVDGVILLQTSTVADVKMRIYNRDGSEAEMCGNGVRCLVRFLEHQGDTRKTFRIETMERILTATNEGEVIAVEMGAPTEMQWNQTITIENEPLTVHHINTGVPHAVTFEPLDFDTYAAKIRHHPHFAPKGANANLAQIQSDGSIILRTFERGVEAETLACGTGATATALAASRIYGLKSPIAIQTKSKEFLHVSFTKKGDHFTDVTLTGPACLV